MKKKVLLALSIGTTILVGLGSYVRVTGAGLACPDWPLCFGEVIPPGHEGVLQEVGHRYLAAFIGILTAIVSFWLVKSGRKYSLSLACFLFTLLVVQAVFGGLTVLLRLSPIVVTTHLALGTIFLQAVILTTYGTLRPVHESGAASQPRSARIVVALLALIVFGQILLGGFVSSGGAALACLDFPSCGNTLPDGKLLPIQHVQMGHRYLAYMIGVALLLALLFVVKKDRVPARVRKLVVLTFILYFVQIGLGIANVFTRIMPAISVAHLLVAEAMLMKLLLSYRELSPRWAALFQPLAESSDPARVAVRAGAIA